MAKFRADPLVGVVRRSWDQDERLNLSLDEDRWIAECEKGVWSKWNDPLLNLREIIQKPRGEEDCFFIEAQEGMSFDGASELQRQRIDHRQLKDTQLNTQKALRIAKASFVVATIAALPAVYPYLRDFCTYLLNLLLS